MLSPGPRVDRDGGARHRIRGLWRGTRLLRCARRASARRRGGARCRRRRLLHRADDRQARHPRSRRPASSRRFRSARNSAPHGVIVGPDGAPWITDGGQNAIVRVDPVTHAVRVLPLPPDVRLRQPQHADVRCEGPRAGLPGQSGYYGRVVPATGDVKVWKAPRGRGPYGITTTPSGDVYYASLAGNHIARIDTETGAATVIEPPTQRPGRAPRLVRFAAAGSGSATGTRGRSACTTPRPTRWREWKLPGNSPHAYSVWVDRRGQGLAHRMDGQRDRPLRSRHREVRELSVEPLRRQRATDARTRGRSLGRRVGQRAPRDDPGPLTDEQRPRAARAAPHAMPRLRAGTSPRT